MSFIPNVLKTVKRSLPVTISIFLFAACHKFETNPYSTKLRKDAPSDLNMQNVKKILAKKSTSDTVTFVITGDTQRFYDNLDDLVGKVNDMRTVDFLVLAGDITDFGTEEEFAWIYERLGRLDVPSFCAIGNHDMVANGSKIYEKIFGAKNFSFVYNKCKFIFHDTNGREYNFNGQVPDLNFLQNELRDSTVKYFTAVSHVPPFDVDFDPALKEPYVKLWASDKRFLLSVHGHLHSYLDKYFYDDHVRYIVAPVIKKNTARVVKLINGNIINEEITF